MSLAQEEAQRFQHNYIGTEHLLLGLGHIEESFAAAALRSMGIKMEAVRAGVSEALNQAP